MTERISWAGQWVKANASIWWTRLVSTSAEDWMVRQDNELRYRPLAGDTRVLHVADILDITDDVLLGAPKHPHPAPKTSPEIQKTLHWIQNTLDDDEGKTLYLR